MLTRQERVVFVIKTEEGSAWFGQHVPSLADSVTKEAIPGDTLSVTYIVDITYFGEVSVVLRELLAAKDKLNITARELEYGRSLILDIGKSLEGLR